MRLEPSPPPAAPGEAVAHRLQGATQQVAAVGEGEGWNEGEDMHGAIEQVPSVGWVSEDVPGASHFVEAVDQVVIRVRVRVRMRSELLNR